MESNTSLWTDAFLDAARTRTDNLADQTVAEFLGDGQESSINHIFATLRANSDLNRDDLPATLKNYFARAAVLPEWADPEKLKAGEQFFRNYGLQAVMMLYFKSLPSAYACARGAKVLHATGRLEEHRGNYKYFTRRLMETSQFVINVSAPGAFEPGGTGIESAMKARLMHACIRHFISKIEWDAAAYGEPICQEDLAGTMLSFSTYVYEGLKIMELTPDPEELEGNYHLWAVVGHLMGVEPQLIPADSAGGHILGHRILDRNLAPSEWGAELTDALVGFVPEVMGTRLVEPFPGAMVRMYSGDKIADALGLKQPKGCMGRAVPKFMNSLMGYMKRVELNHPELNTIANKIGAKFIQRLIQHYYKHKNVDFYLPSSLRKDWKIPD